MDDNKYSNARKYCARIIFTILILISILDFVLLIYGGVIYNVLGNNNIMTNYFMLYCLIQMICSFITAYYILIGIGSCCYYRCNNHNSNLESTYCALPLIIIAIIVMFTYLLSCASIGLISYNFFAYETVSYDYFVLMLIFVILSLIAYGIPLLCMAIMLVLSIFVIWPITTCISCMSKKNYYSSYRNTNFL